MKAKSSYNFEKKLNDLNDPDEIVDSMIFSWLNSDDDFFYTLALTSLLFECNSCGKCCKEIEDIQVNGKDIQRIAKYLNINGGEFRKKFTRKAALKTTTSHISLHVPCPFLEENRCTIYPVRPRICILYPCFVGRYDIDDSGRRSRITMCNQFILARKMVKENHELTEKKVEEFMARMRTRRKKGKDEGVSSIPF
jgi:Fe-S-cluster containining protein